METWYLLFGGCSEDGRGDGKFIGRTTDAGKAYQHFKACESSPYSVGKVLIVTDEKMEQARWDTKWNFT